MDTKELILALSDSYGSQENRDAVTAAVIADMEVEPFAALRRINSISITGLVREVTDKAVTVTVSGEMNGRKDSATGSIGLEGLNQAEFANAVKGAETQAKRRLTSSMLGFGFKGLREEAVTPADSNVAPKVPDTPKLNTEQAAVVADLRLPITLDVTEAQAIAAKALASVPAVTEEAIGRMHQAATELSKPQPDLMSIVEKPAAPVIAAQPQSGFFDEEPTQPPTVISTPVQVAAATPPPAPEPVQTVGEPEAVKDIVIPPAPTTDKPNRLQFQGYTQRCTKLVRDFLPKAGKDIPGLLLPFLKKSFGVADLQQATILQWEEMLGKLEQGTPAQAASLIKGGK